MYSAFGVDHGQIYKADDRKMRNVTGGIGAASTGLAGATAGIGLAEHRGHDPFGFAHPGKFKPSGTGKNQTWKPVSQGARKKILTQAKKAHGKQAAVAGAVGLAGLGAAGAYQHRMNKVAKADKQKSGGGSFGAADVAGGAASAGAVAAGGSSAHMLGSHVRHHMHFLPQDKKDVARLKGWKKPDAARIAHLQQQVKYSRRVVGIKGAGAALGAGVAGAGGYGLYQTGKKAVQSRKA